MSNYELTLLLKNEKDLNTVNDLVKSLDGKITKDDSWGEKTLAYPIKKNRSAYFHQLSIDMSPDKLTEFRKKLDFDEKLIRFLLLLVN